LHAGLARALQLYTALSNYRVMIQMTHHYSTLYVTF
jgi:hypothetical protein